MTDADYMRLALEQAHAAAEHGEVPIGAIVVSGDQIVARAGNRTITDCDPSAHAEIAAIREAAQALGNYRLLGSTLYVTMEPCAMCAGAMIQARIARVIYGCDDPKGGAVRTCFSIFDHPAVNHHVEAIGGMLAADCAGVLQSFFASRR